MSSSRGYEQNLEIVSKTEDFGFSANFLSKLSVCKNRGEFLLTQWKKVAIKYIRDIKFWNFVMKPWPSPISFPPYHPLILSPSQYTPLSHSPSLVPSPTPTSLFIHLPISFSLIYLPLCEPLLTLSLPSSIALSLPPSLFLSISIILWHHFSLS